MDQMNCSAYQIRGTHAKKGAPKMTVFWGQSRGGAALSNIHYRFNLDAVKKLWHVCYSDF